MDYKKLGERVRTARKKKGYTQGKLAELTGYSVQHISHVENGETKLSVDFLLLLAENLDISLDELAKDSLKRCEQNDEIIDFLLKGCSQDEIIIISKTIINFKKNLKSYTDKLLQ